MTLPAKAKKPFIRAKARTRKPKPIPFNPSTEKDARGRTFSNSRKRGFAKFLLSGQRSQLLFMLEDIPLKDFEIDQIKILIDHLDEIIENW